jgi:hypothetical protein
MYLDADARCTCRFEAISNPLALGTGSYEAFFAADRAHGMFPFALPCTEVPPTAQPNVSDRLSRAQSRGASR